MPAIRATNSAVFIVHLHSLLASGALIGHLLRLQGLPHRPKYRAPNGSVRYEGASRKGIATFGAIPDG